MMKKGFTLIEIIVSIAIFVLVMLMALGAVLNAVDANRKAQNLNIVVNNLNLAIESMVRDIRTGHDYVLCDYGGCNGILFTNRLGQQIGYDLFQDDDGTYYIRKIGGNVITSGRITSSEVVIEEADFKLKGEGSGDGPQRILLHIKGYTGGNKTKSEFNIQTLITSRTLDAAEFI